MAEAAASEKGLSEEEKVREMLLFPDRHPSVLLSLSCADLPGYLKPNRKTPQNLPAFSSVPGFVSFRTLPPQTRKGQLPPLFQGSISYVR